jgi:hypothetical protein
VGSGSVFNLGSTGSLLSHGPLQIGDLQIEIADAVPDLLDELQSFGLELELGFNVPG